MKHYVCPTRFILISNRPHLPFVESSYAFFQKIFLKFISIERGLGGEREGEDHQCERETSISCLLSRPNQGRNHNPGMCRDRDSNPLPFALLGNAQPIEPGLHFFFFLNNTKVALDRLVYFIFKNIDFFFLRGR